MASRDASWIKEQVFTIRISAFEGSRLRGYPASERSPSMTSESTRFFGHPRLTRHTVSFIHTLYPSLSVFSKAVLLQEQGCFIDPNNAEFMEACLVEVSGRKWV